MRLDRGANHQEALNLTVDVIEDLHGDSLVRECRHHAHQFPLVEITGYEQVVREAENREHLHHEFARTARAGPHPVGPSECGLLDAHGSHAVDRAPARRCGFELACRRLHPLQRAGLTARDTANGLRDHVHRGGHALDERDGLAANGVRGAAERGDERRHHQQYCERPRNAPADQTLNERLERIRDQNAQDDRNQNDLHHHSAQTMSASSDTTRMGPTARSMLLTADVSVLICRLLPVGSSERATSVPLRSLMRGGVTAKPARAQQPTCISYKGDRGGFADSGTICSYRAPTRLSDGRMKSHGRSNCRTRAVAEPQATRRYGSSSAASS